MNKFSVSAFSLSLVCAVFLLANLVYYPKWKKPQSEATISYDVSGYYTYLPAIFIYGDLKKLQFFETVNAQYQACPGGVQAFDHASGNKIIKYSCGQALQFLPAFLCAHALAAPLGYAADGFSRPYQLAISLWSLLICFLGLWVLRKILLRFFAEGPAAATLLLLALGTNYLNYAAIDGAMTHNWLFTLTTLLLWATIRFYEKPTHAHAAVIGLLLGWAVLTRPTEIVLVVIPLLWGLRTWANAPVRLDFFKKNLGKIALAALVAASVGGLQLMYWKYVSGEWLVYSYQEQGFDWLHPHLRDVLISAKAGWLMYAPAMLFAIAGLFFLKKHKKSEAESANFEGFWAVLLYCCLAVYVTAAWSIWWYGGSLGQRALVQGYPIWAFPMAAFWTWAGRKTWRTGFWGALALFFAYISLWWTHQARGEGLFQSEQMNTPYYFRVVGRWQKDPMDLKLLDNRDFFDGPEPATARVVFADNFEDDSVCVSEIYPIQGRKSVFLDKNAPLSPLYEFSLPQKQGWLRVFFTFQNEPKEWDVWRMPQAVLTFKQGDKVVKTNAIKLSRYVGGGEHKRIFFDARLPEQAFERVGVSFSNGSSEKTLRADSLVVMAW